MATLRLIKPKETAETGYKPMTPWQLALRRFKRNKLAIVGAVIVFLFLFMAIFAPIISPHPYDRTNMFRTFTPPGVAPEYPLGTDSVGRDLLSRLIWGANTSFIVGVSAQAFALAVGLILGFLSGWLGGWMDFAVNRLIEVVGSMPGLLFQILVMSMIGNGVLNVTFAIAILSWPGFVRIARAQVLSFKNRDFIDAARSLGASTPFIAWRHILPNIINPILVAVTFGIPGFMLAEAGLSFLGRGINDPIPSWGKMLSEAQYYVQSYIYMGIIPTVLIVVVFLGFSFFGDGVRDALDPQSDQAKA